MGFLARRHLWNGPEKGAVETHFGRAVFLAAGLRCIGHILHISSQLESEQSNFGLRFSIALSVTLLHLPLCLATRSKLGVGSWAFVLLHILNIVQFPVDAVVFGSTSHESWLYFIFMHLMCCMLMAHNTFKATTVGLFAVSVLPCVFLDKDFVQLNATHTLVPVATLCFSIMEWMGARLSAQVDERDARIRELAEQNENGMRMLSHDMANVLSIAGDNLELGLEEMEEVGTEIDSVVRSRLENARSALAQGVGILHATRDYLAVSAGKKDPNLETFPVRDLLEDVAGIWRRAAERKNLNIKVSLHPNVSEEMVSGSRAAFTHTILGNLVSNAIKFSPQKCTILILAAQDSDPDFLILEVRDQGAGIPDGKLHTLFNFQAPTTSVGTQGEKGTGFGLPLVKSALEAFGGSISVLSMPPAIASAAHRRTDSEASEKSKFSDVGACFRCRIPKANRAHGSLSNQTKALTHRDMKAS